MCIQFDSKFSRSIAESGGLRRYLSFPNITSIALIIIPTVTASLWFVHVQGKPILSDTEHFPYKITRAVTLASLGNMITTAIPMLLERKFKFKFGETWLRIANALLGWLCMLFILFWEEDMRTSIVKTSSYSAARSSSGVPTITIT